MTRFKKASLLILFTMFICSVNSTMVVAQSTPACDCETLHPDLGEAYFTCISDGCTGVNVPVSGNIWVLALAGFVFAFVKFGGHTRLAGYYYTKIDKQE